MPERVTIWDRLNDWCMDGLHKMRVTINSLREDLRRHQAEVNAEMLGEPYKPKPMKYPPHMREERDVMFQIRVMDWMIGFCVVALVVVLIVGVWAIYRMVTVGWTW